jgi:hypothetical protein
MNMGFGSRSKETEQKTNKPELRPFKRFFYIAYIITNIKYIFHVKIFAAAKSD